MSSPRIWTVEEANAVLPRLTTLLARQLESAAEIGRGLRRLLFEVGDSDLVERCEHGESVALRPDELLSAAKRGSEEVRAFGQALSERIAGYEAGWREVEELGVVVKDPRVGLCDFFGRIDGKLVWLCWRYGEDKVAYYHDLDAGFAGRRPLTDATRRRMLN